VWRVQIHAKVAQLVEHSTENAGVVGSIPSLGTNHQVPQVIVSLAPPLSSRSTRFMNHRLV
jgi:hypothetical protein